MKILALIVLLRFSVSAMAQNLPEDTVVRSVFISFRYSKFIFPEPWQQPPISASGQPVAASEVARCKRILSNALKKYPLALLQQELQSVYFLGSMNFYNVGYGGTNSVDAVYLTDNGEEKGYTDLYLEQTFHHEFSSILYRNHSAYFNESAWLLANMPGFKYNDPENGVGAIRNNQSSQELDTALCARGFLTEYAQSGMENDLNTFAQNMFAPSPGFWRLVDNYPRIAAKFNLLQIFFSQLNPAFTEQFFRRLSR